MGAHRNITKRISPKRWLQRAWWMMLFIVAALLLYYVFYFLLRGPLPVDPQFIAHRGGPAHHPENTMAAFRHAIQIGADWLEMDIQRTSDGELVVFHDQSLERIAGSTRTVKDMTLEQLQALDVGNGERVPSFEEVILLAREAGIGLMPEAKLSYLYPGIETQMVAAVAEEGYLQSTLFQSFDMASVANFSRSGEIMVCPLYQLWWEIDAGAPPSNSQVLCPMAESVLIYPWLIRKAHKDGRKVYIWFGLFENPFLIRVMLSLGVDGLMVDDLETFARMLGR